MWPVKLESVNGHVEASILGAPEWRVEGDTREEALVALRTEVDRRVQTGEIVLMAPSMPTPPRRGSISALAGTVTGERAEMLKEIVAEAYRRRDAEKNLEVGDEGV